MISYPFTSNVTYDEAGQPTFDRAIGSEDLRKLYMKDRGNGVVMLDDSTALQVVANSGMKVNVKTGYCFINGATGCQDTVKSFTLSGASATYNRIDSIVARYSTVNRNIDLFVKVGTAAANPQPPEITRTNTVYEIALAEITIKKGAIAITQGDIFDTRPDPAKCGYSLPLQEIDTTHLTDQIENQVQTNIDLIQSALDGTTAGNLQNQITALDGRETTAESNISVLQAKTATLETTTDNLQEQVDNIHVDEMIGATASKSGTAGVVPAPQAGYQDRYLAGDGTWRTLPTIPTKTSQLVNDSGYLTNTNIADYVVSEETKTMQAVGSSSSGSLNWISASTAVKVRKWKSGRIDFDQLKPTNIALSATGTALGGLIISQTEYPIVNNENGKITVSGYRGTGVGYQASPIKYYKSGSNMILVALLYTNQTSGALNIQVSLTLWT